MKLTTALRNFCLDSGFATAFDGGGAVLELRTGAAPATAGAALTGTVLSSVVPPNDAFTAAAAGSIAKNGTWQDASADASGTAGYAVLRFAGDTTGADNTVLRAVFSLTATGGGGEVEIDSTSVTATQPVTVTSIAITQPAS